MSGYDYDVAVIGGGSGGLSAAKECARLGAKVAVFDYVVLSPAGSTWGLGGTCVNVGCIPKKLFHYAASLRSSIKDCPKFGWEVEEKDLVLRWEKLVETVNNVAKGANFSYRSALRAHRVTYYNAMASFVDANTVEYKQLDGTLSRIRSKVFVLAVGTRPRFPSELECVGAATFGVSSDDLFTLPRPPGRTLVVGASYIALECAGFLSEMGFPVTVMVRSQLLRGFDRQMARLLGGLLEIGGVKFLLNTTPSKLERHDPKGLISVTHKTTPPEPSSEASTGNRASADAATAPNGKRSTDTATDNQAPDAKSSTEAAALPDEKSSTSVGAYDTVLFAIGRDAAAVRGLGLEKAGVVVDKVSGKIVAGLNDETNVSHIFAIGDCVRGRPELAPTAIRSGLLLARRLYGGSVQRMGYEFVPTAVFTPYEYGCVGMSEEEAVNTFGRQAVETYLSRFSSTEMNAASRVPHAILSHHFHEQDESAEEKLLKRSSVAKVIVDKTRGDRILGMHYIGLNAAEIIQGFSVALALGANKSHLDSLMALHPTAAEEFTMLSIKGSQCPTDSHFYKKGGCCG